ncbi:MAG: hypothetical protein QXL17_06175 [Candidatus Thermoplasmatota archaeon]
MSIEKERHKTSTITITRLELWLTPLLVIIPCLVSFLMIYEWYIHGLLHNDIRYTPEGMVGAIILIGNIIFAVPFVKTILIKTNKRNEK